MNTSAPLRSPETDEQFLPLNQAAQLLSVHVSTIRRWIRQGKLPAYRVGDKGVRVRRGDVLQLLTPLVPENGRYMAKTDKQPVRRLTPEEQERALGSIARVEKLRREIIAERGGRLFPDSAELIHQERMERTRQLMQSTDE